MASPLTSRRRPLSWRTLGFREVVVLTAPVLAVLLYLLGASIVDYYRSLQFDDYWSNSINLSSRFQDRVNQLVRLPRAVPVRQRLTTEADDAGIIDLAIDQPGLDFMYQDPQLNWGVWTEGILEQHDKLLPVSIRKRGDNSVHWLTDKRTLTVRTPRTDFYKRFRLFGLSTKTPLTSYVANRLAAEFELLAPSTTVVPVFINNQYSGMFRFLESVDESFLRPYNRMPGNIFRGDAAERSDYFKGLPRDVFANPYIWNRVAANDRPTAAGTGQLRLFIEEINSSRFEDHLRLMGRIDRGEIARLLSYLLLLGDPYHMDATHNQLWYEDPSTSLLHPIPWDIRLLRLSSRPPRRLSAFFRAALRDPFLVDEILANVTREVNSGRIVRTADSLAVAIWSRYRDGFVYDSLRLGMVSELGYPSEVHEVLTANIETLKQWLADATAVYATGQAGGVTVLDLDIRGLAGIDLLGVDGAGPTTLLRIDRNLNGVLDDDDPVVASRQEPGGQVLLVEPLPLLSAWRTDLPGIRPGSQHYRLFVIGGVAGEVRPILQNRHTRQAVVSGSWERQTPIAPPQSWSPWQYPQETGRLHRMAGTVRLTADLRLGRLDTLVIAPGTTIRLDPDVSIVSRGRVIAAGTAGQPIVFTRADPEQPWGAFSLQGSGADSSVFRYVTWEWGGGDLVDRVEYIGMVNLHRVSGVTVEHAIFRDNLRSDDTFHALHSDLILRNSRFARANSDAVDFDVATGIIEDNIFEDTGGDAIDLMASTPMIRNNRILRSKDKGISVGENSSPVLFGNHIEGCRRGIEVKDRSDPIALNNTLVSNGVAIVTDRKNWRYGGGGFGTFINNSLRDNGVPLELDEFSRITIAHTSRADSGMQYIGHGNDEAIGNLDGLYRRFGIERAYPAGATASARLVSPVPPYASVRFEEDFISTSDGWQRHDGVGRVYKDNRTLHATAETRPGMIGQRVDWDLRRSGSADLVLEVATSDMDSVRVTVVSEQGSVSSAVALSGNPSVFRLVTLKLPPRKYTALVLEMTPHPRIEKVVETGWTELKPGQLWLRGYDIYLNPSSPTVLGRPGS